MSNFEQLPSPVFELEGFDLNEAFQGAMSDVACDTESTLDDKIRRMETIITEGSTEIYRDFVDFRALASQIQMMCGHNHETNATINNSDILSGFMNEHAPHQNHDHDAAETKTKAEKKKKKKKQSGWLAFAFK